MNTSTIADFTVAKFDGNGTVVWVQNVNGTATNSFGQARSVAVDNLGNAVAVGMTMNVGTFVGFTVAKFDPDGTLLWQQNLNGTATNSNDQALSARATSCAVESRQRWKRIRPSAVGS